MRLLLLLGIASNLLALDALEIVRRSIDRDQSNWERAKAYTYISRSTVRERDSSGQVKKTEQETNEILYLFGEPHERLLEKDGKPLPAAEQKKEQEKLDRLVAKRSRETPAERQKRVEAYEKKRREMREFAREIPEAYHFKLLGEETINGRKAWIIDASPREDYKPKMWRAGMLKKFHGKMWVDQQEYQWVRLEGEAIDTVTFGLFLARLAKGSKIFFEQVRVNDEVWMPKQIKVDMDARIALLKRLQGDLDVRYSDYRKFQSESRILATTEIGAKP